MQFKGERVGQLDLARDEARKCNEKKLQLLFSCLAALEPAGKTILSFFKTAPSEN